MDEIIIYCKGSLFIGNETISIGIEIEGREYDCNVFERDRHINKMATHILHSSNVLKDLFPNIPYHFFEHITVEADDVYDCTSIEEWFKDNKPNSRWNELFTTLHYSMGEVEFEGDNRKYILKLFYKTKK